MAYQTPLDSKRAKFQACSHTSDTSALGKQACVQFATCLSSSFGTSVCLDDKASFACRGIRPLHSCMAPIAVPGLAQACALPGVPCAKLSRLLLRQGPAALTVLTVLQRWPDNTLGRRLIEGFRLIGAIEAPSVLRDISPEPPKVLGVPSLLGDHAARVIAKLNFARFPG